MLFTQLVPEGMEGVVVRAVYNMTQSARDYLASYQTLSNSQRHLLV